MPLIDKPLPELFEYRGRNPRPDDFDAYWSTALQELDATPPNPELRPNAFVNSQTRGGGSVRLSLVSVDVALCAGPRKAGQSCVTASLASGRGLNEAEVSAALHVGRATVRRWLQRFRRAGILGLQTLPRQPAGRVGG